MRQRTETNRHHRDAARSAARSRWAALGAAVTVSLGAGGLLTTSASVGSGERAVYVPITPCRVMDTRVAPDNVGPRHTPIGPNEVHAITVRGTNGNCTIPTDAVGVVMNVAVIAPTAASFLTVYPADASRPVAANLNWTAGQPPLSNAVTADISGDGRVAFYNLTGTVDVAADIVGFYVDHQHDDRYYTKGEVDAALAAVRPPAATRVPLDSVGMVGSFTAIAVGNDGLPIVAYGDIGQLDLKVAKCTSAGCTGATTFTTVDSIGDVGNYVSIAIGTDGLPVIAYNDGTNNDLKVAKCVNPSCTGSATITTVDSAGDVGTSTSIAIGADGLPVVSYLDATNFDLKVAKCANVACTGAATITTVDAVGNVGYFSSLAVPPDGLPVISYFDLAVFGLRVAKCINPACTGIATVTPISAPSTVSYDPSMVVGANGLPVIAYQDLADLDLEIAACTTVACTGPVVFTTLDSTSDVGHDPAITIGRDGFPVIAHRDEATGDLRVAKCGNAACSGAASLAVVDASADVGLYAAIATGADGMPIISHYDADHADLRIAKCASVTCLP